MRRSQCREICGQGFDSAESESRVIRRSVILAWERRWVWAKVSWEGVCTSCAEEAARESAGMSSSKFENRKWQPSTTNRVSSVLLCFTNDDRYWRKSWPTKEDDCLFVSRTSWCLRKRIVSAETTACDSDWYCIVKVRMTRTVTLDFIGSDDKIFETVYLWVFKRIMRTKYF